LKLSILIPTLPESSHYLDRILNCLGKHEEVEVIIDDRGRDIPTGTKRNDLIQKASAPYFSFVDCDDLTFNYIPEILKAIEKNPDVVTFQGFMTTDGSHKTDFIIKLGEGYEQRAGKYYRWPNHLCAFKKSKVEHVKFPNTWHGEDYAWSIQIRQLNLLESEVHIPYHLYHYDFRTQK
jgi:glycosyltransferase involved in cell wall biosynthesis